MLILDFLSNWPYGPYVWFLHKSQCHSKFEIQNHWNLFNYVQIAASSILIWQDNLLLKWIFNILRNFGTYDGSDYVIKPAESLYHLLQLQQALAKFFRGFQPWRGQDLANAAEPKVSIMIWEGKTLKGGCKWTSAYFTTLDFSGASWWRWEPWPDFWGHNHWPAEPPSPSFPFRFAFTGQEISCSYALLFPLQDSSSQDFSYHPILTFSSPHPSFTGVGLAGWFQFSLTF